MCAVYIDVRQIAGTDNRFNKMKNIYLHIFGIFQFLFRFHLRVSQHKYILLMHMVTVDLLTAKQKFLSNYILPSFMLFKCKKNNDKTEQQQNIIKKTQITPSLRK